MFDAGGGVGVTFDGTGVGFTSAVLFVTSNVSRYSFGKIVIPAFGYGSAERSVIVSPSVVINFPSSIALLLVPIPETERRVALSVPAQIHVTPSAHRLSSVTLSSVTELSLNTAVSPERSVTFPYGNTERASSGGVGERGDVVVGEVTVKIGSKTTPSFDPPLFTTNKTAPKNTNTPITMMTSIFLFMVITLIGIY
jgi:hypothetical protein